MKKFLKRTAIAALGALSALSASFGLAACNFSGKGSDVKEETPSTSTTTEDIYSTLERTPSDNSKPASYTAEQNLYFVAYTLSQQTQYHAYARCDSLAAVANQVTKTWKDYKNGVMVCSDLTYTSGSSLIQAGTQSCFTPVGTGDDEHTEVFMRTAKSTVSESSTPTTLSWDSSSPKRYATQSAYEADYGSYSTELSVYILNHDTIDWEASSNAVKDNNDGTFTIQFILNPELATYYYGNAMQTRGSLKRLPDFKSIDISFTFDENWRILSTYCEEVAEIVPKAAGGIKTTSTSITTTTFSYDSEDFDSEHFGYYDSYYSRYALNPSESTEDGTVTETTQLDALTILGNGFGGILSDEGQQFAVTLNLGDKTYYGYLYLAIDINGLGGDNPLDAVHVRLNLAKGRQPDPDDIFIQLESGVLDVFFSQDFYLTADVAELVGIKTAVAQAQETLDNQASSTSAEGIMAVAYALADSTETQQTEKASSDILGTLINSLQVTQGVGTAKVRLKDSNFLGMGIGLDIRLNFTLGKDDEITFRSATISNLSYQENDIAVSASLTTTDADIISYNPTATPVDIKDIIYGIDDLMSLNANDLLAVNLKIDGDSSVYDILHGVGVDITAYIAPDGKTVSGTIAATYTSRSGYETSITLSVWYQNAKNAVAISISEINGTILEEPICVECSLSDAGTQLNSALSKLFGTTTTEQSNAAQTVKAKKASASLSNLSVDSATLVTIVNNFLNADLGQIFKKIELVDSHMAVIVDVDELLTILGNDNLSKLTFGTAALAIDWRDEAEHFASLDLSALGLGVTLDVEKDGVTSQSFPVGYPDLETFILQLDKTVKVLLGVDGSNVNTVLTVIDDQLLGQILSDSTNGYGVEMNLNGKDSGIKQLEDVSLTAKMYFDNRKSGDDINRIRALSIENLTVGETVKGLKADLTYDNRTVYIKLYVLNGMNFEQNGSSGLGLSVTATTIYEAVNLLVEQAFNGSLLQQANNYFGFIQNSQESTANSNTTNSNTSSSVDFANILTALFTLDYNSLFEGATVVKDSNGNVLSADIDINLDNFLATLGIETTTPVANITANYVAENNVVNVVVMTKANTNLITLSAGNVEQQADLTNREDCMSVEYIIDVVEAFQQGTTNGLYKLFNMTEADLLKANIKLSGEDCTYTILQGLGVDITAYIAPDGKTVSGTIVATYTSRSGYATSITLSVWYQNAKNAVAISISEINGTTLEEPICVECSLSDAGTQLNSALSKLFGTTTETEQATATEQTTVAVAAEYPVTESAGFDLSSLLSNFLTLDFTTLLQKVEVANGRVGVMLDVDELMKVFGNTNLSKIAFGNLSLDVDLTESTHVATLGMTNFGLTASLDVAKDEVNKQSFPVGYPDLETFILQLDKTVKVLLGVDGSNVNTVLTVIDDQLLGQILSDSTNGYGVEIGLNGKDSGIKQLEDVSLTAKMYFDNRKSGDDINRIRALSIENLTVGETVKGLKADLTYDNRTVYIKLYALNGMDFEQNGSSGLGLSVTATTIYEAVNLLVEQAFNGSLLQQANNYFGFIQNSQENTANSNTSNGNTSTSVDFANILTTLFTLDYNSLFEGATVVKDSNGNVLSADIDIDLDTFLATLGIETTTPVADITANYVAENNVVNVVVTTKANTQLITLSAGNVEQQADLTNREDCMSVEYIIDVVETFRQGTTNGLYKLFNMTEADLLKANIKLSGEDCDYKILQGLGVDITAYIAPDGKTVNATLNAEYKTANLDNPIEVEMEVWYTNTQAEPDTVYIQLKKFGLELDKAITVKLSLSNAEEQLESAWNELFGLVTETTENDIVAVSAEYQGLNTENLTKSEGITLSKILTNFLKLDFTALLQKVEVANGRVGVMLDVDELMKVFGNTNLSNIEFGNLSLDVDLTENAEHFATLDMEELGLTASLDVEKDGVSNVVYPANALGLDEFIATLNESLKLLIGENGANIKQIVTVIDDEVFGALLKDAANGYGISIDLNGDDSGIKQLAGVTVQAKIYLENKQISESETSTIRSLSIENLTVNDSFKNLKADILYENGTFYIQLYNLNDMVFENLAVSVETSSVYELVNQLVDILFQTDILKEVNGIFGFIKSDSTTQSSDITAVSARYDEGTTSTLQTILTTLLQADFSKLFNKADITKDDDGNIVSADILVDIDSLASLFGIDSTRLGKVIATYQKAEGTLSAQAWNGLKRWLTIVGNYDEAGDSFENRNFMSLDFMTTLLSDLRNTATNANDEVYETFSFTGNISINVASIATITLDTATLTIGADETQSSSTGGTDSFYVSLLAHMKKSTLSKEYNISVTYSHGYITLGREVGTASAKFKVMTLEYLMLNLLDSESSPIRWLLGTSDSLWKTVCTFVKLSLATIDTPVNVNAIWDPTTQHTASSEDEETTTTSTTTIDMQSLLTAFVFTDSDGTQTNVYGSNGTSSNLTLKASNYLLNLDLSKLTSGNVGDVYLAINRDTKQSATDGDGYFISGISLYTTLVSAFKITANLNTYLEGVTPGTIDLKSDSNLVKANKVTIDNFYTEAGVAQEADWSADTYYVRTVENGTVTYTLSTEYVKETTYYLFANNTYYVKNADNSYELATEYKADEDYYVNLSISTIASPNFYNAVKEAYGFDFDTASVQVKGATKVAYCFATEDYGTKNNPYYGAATALIDYVLTVNRPEGEADTYIVNYGSTVTLYEGDKCTYTDESGTEYIYYYKVNGKALPASFVYTYESNLEIVCEKVKIKAVTLYGKADNEIDFITLDEKGYEGQSLKEFKFDGKVVIGWYEDEALTKAIDTMPESGVAYAKFARDEVVIENITYTLNVADEAYYITACGTLDSKYTVANGQDALVLQNTIDTLPVTKINASVFKGVSLKRVIIPENITYVGAQAFMDNKGMEYAVFLADNVVMGGVTNNDNNRTPFYGCSKSDATTAEDKISNLVIYYKSITSENGDTETWKYFKKSNLYFGNSGIGTLVSDTSTFAAVTYEVDGGTQFTFTGLNSGLVLTAIDAQTIQSNILKQINEVTAAYDTPYINGYIVNVTVYHKSGEVVNVIGLDAELYTVKIEITEATQNRMYTVTVSANDGGKAEIAGLPDEVETLGTVTFDHIVSYNGKVFVKSGTELTINTTANDGYYLDSFVVNGEDIDTENGNIFTVTMGNAKTTINAIFYDESNRPKNVTLYSAVAFNYNGKTYTIGKTELKTGTLADAEAVENNTYQFMGWAKKSGDTYQFIDVETETLLDGATYYAIWVAKKNNVTYSINVANNAIVATVNAEGSAVNSWYVYNAENRFAQQLTAETDKSLKLSVLSDYTVIPEIRLEYNLSVTVNGQKSALYFNDNNVVEWNDSDSSYTETMTVLEGNDVTLSFANNKMTITSGDNTLTFYAKKRSKNSWTGKWSTSNDLRSLNDTSEHPITYTVGEQGTVTLENNISSETIENVDGVVAITIKI